MKLSREDAIYISGVFENYFSHHENIDAYMREQKLTSLQNMPSNPLFPPEDELFWDFSIHPNYMDFSVIQIPNKQWDTLTSITSSHIVKDIPARNFKLAVIENNTKKLVGFIRFGSPVINCKPRNEMLQQVFSQNKENARRFNQSAMMGFTIVPAQPFGYNYLGGKLLAAICTSHEVREMCNKRYDMNLCLFETTSLYGTSKTVSQYDGMKPYIRFKGVTESNFIPMMHGTVFDNLKDFVESRVGKLVDDDSSSKKLSTIMKIISLVKMSLRGTPEGEKFAKIIEDAKSLTEQKRYYVSTYGFKNYKEYVNNQTDTLVPDDNFDKHYLENIIKWWKKKASNRYETLLSENRLRKDIEVWTSGKDIDMIR